MKVFFPVIVLALLAAVLSLVLLVGGTTAQTGPLPRVMVDFDDSTTLRVGEWHELARWPREVTQPQTSWRTDKLATLAVGPFNLKAGDVLDIRLHHEFDNEMDGAGYWTIDGVKSEHWSLWTMEATSVLVGSSIGSSAGAVAVPQQEENWDWFVHHKAVNRSGFYEVPADCTSCYVYDRVYFVSGMSYTRPEVEFRQVQINPAPYAKLSVATFRNVP